MQSVVTGFVSRFGYWGVLLLIAVENIFPPIPSEVNLTFGGFLTTYTEMTPPGVILFSTLGSVAGAIVLYGVGRLLAPQRLEALVSGRVGRALKMESADVHKASDWFAAHGWPSVFYCRCIPILRSLISIPAGMAGMRLAPFLLLTTVGSLLWNILLVYLGALTGQSWPAVTAALEQASGWVKAALAVGGRGGRFGFFLRQTQKAPGRAAMRRAGAGENGEEKIKPRDLLLYLPGKRESLQDFGNRQTGQQPWACLRLFENNFDYTICFCPFGKHYTIHSAFARRQKRDGRSRGAQEVGHAGPIQRSFRIDGARGFGIY